MAGQKRKAVTDAAETPSTRRQSGRVGKARVSYQESHSDVEASASDDEFKEVESEAEKEGSDDDFDEDDEKGKEVEEDDDDANVDDGEDDEYEKKLKKQGWKKKVGSNGKVSMVRDIPQAKDDGGVPYEDDRIHPNTLDFLKDLKENNRRDWLKFHDAVFRQAEKDFHTFVSSLSPIISQKDPTIPELPIKDVIYRIYRDVRFSSDPTPYKIYFSVTWSRTGRKGPYAHYYLHIQPGGGSFLAGGYFGSDNLTLACLREDIDQQPHQFKSILTGDKLRKTFFPALANKKDEKKVVEAFCKMSGENALKKKPKGYDADHVDINLMKLRNYILRKNISDEEVLSGKFLDIVSDYVEAIEPFITYLNAVVMPDR